MLLNLSSAEVDKIINKKANKTAVDELITVPNDKTDELDTEKAKQLLASIIKYVGDFDLKRKNVELKNTVSNENEFHLIGYSGNLNYHFLLGRANPKFNTNVGIAIDHPYCFKQGLIVILSPENIVNNKDVTTQGINKDFIVLHLHDHLRNTRNETFLVLRRKDYLSVKDSFELSCEYDIVRFNATLAYSFETA